MNAIVIPCEIQPDPNCFCSVCEWLRVIERNARLAEAVNNWHQERLEQPAIYFGKAAE